MVVPSDEAPVIYGLEYPARSLASQQGQSELIRFYVGTQTLTNENQVHVVEYDEEEGAIFSRAYRHPRGEVWHLATSPTHPQVFATAYSKGHADDGKCETGASIWKVPLTEEPIRQLADDAETYAMEEVLQLQGLAGPVVGVLWSPNSGSELVTVGEDMVQVWDVNTQKAAAQATNSGSAEGKARRFSGGRWNPHHNATQIAVAAGTSIRGWDLRTMKEIYCIEHAHGQQARDMDFNPNKQYYMASGGDDNKVRFWDVRNCTEPLMTLAHHSHWVWCVRYNHFHDQLLLTASSDSQVVLSNVISLSSDPYGHVDPEDDTPRQEQQKDGIIRRYEEHEDSVYVTEWSTADPWVFASLSYDGRLVINHVPKEEKYKILL